MSNSSFDTAFCEKHMKPLIIVLIVIIICIVGWAIYHETMIRKNTEYAKSYHFKVHHRYNTPTGQSMSPAMGMHPGMGMHQGMGMQPGMQPGMGMHQGMGQQAAATTGIPPIKLSDVVTHPYFGQDCTKCHSVIGPASKTRLDGGKILDTANLTHPYWGPCNVCHAIVNAQGKPVAFVSSDPKSIFGVDLTEATAENTTKLNLPDKKGPIITRVTPGGMADQLGMQAGDMFYMIEDRKVETLSELERALGGYSVGDAVRITMWRERRQKVFRLILPAPAVGAAALVPNQAPDPGLNNIQQGTIPDGVNIVAIGSTGADLNSQVSNEFGLSTYFVIVDLKRNTFKILKNEVGTGQQAVNDLMDFGVDAVITGSMGQGVANSLSNLNVKTYTGVSGSVSSAITALRQGQLSEGAGANTGTAPSRRRTF